MLDAKGKYGGMRYIEEYSSLRHLPPDDKKRYRNFLSKFANTCKEHHKVCLSCDGDCDGAGDMVMVAVDGDAHSHAHGDDAW